MSYRYEKQHREAHQSLQAMWKHLFQSMWEDLQAGNVDRARETRKKLEEVFVNSDQSACDLFLKLMEHEQSEVVG